MFWKSTQIRAFHGTTIRTFLGKIACLRKNFIHLIGVRCSSGRGGAAVRSGGALLVPPVRPGLPPPLTPATVTACRSLRGQHWPPVRRGSTPACVLPLHPPAVASV
jgi:hypothetical protein